MIYLSVLPLGFVTSPLVFPTQRKSSIKTRVGHEETCTFAHNRLSTIPECVKPWKGLGIFCNKNTSGDKPNIFWVEFSEGVISGWGDRIIYNDNDINEGESLLNPWIIEFLH